MSLTKTSINSSRFEDGEEFKVRIDNAYNASVSKGETGIIIEATHDCPEGFCGSYGSLMSNPSKCPFSSPVVYLGQVRNGVHWYFRDCDILKLHDQNDIEWYKSPLSQRVPAPKTYVRET